MIFWQSLNLAHWKPLFADIPVESLIFEHQAEYFQALQGLGQLTAALQSLAEFLEVEIGLRRRALVQRLVRRDYGETSERGREQ